MRASEQVMTKMRLRRLLEEMLDGDIVQLDIEEAEEEASTAGRQPLKRVTLVARYVPA